MERYDCVIVGARCAGATLGAMLARTGRSVLMLDKDPLGSDTLSTHIVFPNTIARLEQLGVLGRLSESHRLRPVEYCMRLLGREFAGAFTPVDGRDRCLCIRRPALDRALGEAALAAGVQARFEEKVTGLLGGASEDDPIRGVTLSSGERIGASWVFGADGRASLVARELGLELRGRMAGDYSMLLSYWQGLPASRYLQLDMEQHGGVSWFPCEDGVDLLVSVGPADHTRGDRQSRERQHIERLREFPATIDPEWLEHAERISDVRVAPETMLRGFFKQAAGPGWALIGDAGHFKHPGSAQGICDAIEQAIHVAEALDGDDPLLRDYERWRDGRAEGHYEWSFTLGRLPQPDAMGPVADGLRDDPAAGQDFRDTHTRRVHPSDAISARRLAAWFGTPESAATRAGA